MSPLWDDQGDTGPVYIRTGIVQMPAIGVGATVDLAVSWSPPMPGTAYVVPKPGIEGAVALLGSLDAVLKTGTQTINGCTVSVKNSSLVPISLGAGFVHVIAYMNG